MEEDYNTDSVNSGANNKVRGFSDFVSILRDRWLISVALSLPMAPGYVFYKYQDTEFINQTSFRLVPPPAVLNLQKVDRNSCQIINIKTFGGFE